MSCDKCEKWNHPDCEIKYGKDPEYRAAEEKRRADEAAEAQRVRAAKERKAEIDLESQKVKNDAEK